MADVGSSTECESETELMAEGMGRGDGAVAKRLWVKKLCSNNSYTLTQSSPPPRDRWNVVYVCMLMAGAGFIFPWSSYVTAIDYFFFLYWKDFRLVSVVIPMTYLVSTWFFTGLNISIVNVVPLHMRIGLGYVLFLTSLIAIPVLDLLVHSCLLSIHAAFTLTILSVAVVGVGSGVQQSSYYGLSGMLPSRYVQAIMAGESVATTSVSITRIITKSSIDNERFGAIAFFLVSIAFISVCVGCQQIIRASPFVKYHVRQCSKKSSRERGEGGEGEELKLEDRGGDDREGLLDTPQEHVSFISRARAGLLLRWRVTVEIWQLLVAVFVCFFVTLLVFPGLVSLVQHCGIGDWTPILLVTVFNVPDLIAKWVVLVPLPWTPSGLMTGSFTRAVLLLPILLLVSPSPSQPLISSGTLAWAVGLVALLGFTNGYFGSLPMISFSKKVKNRGHLEVAGTIMTLSLLSGLMVGSVLAYALTPLTSLAEYTECSSNATALFHSCPPNSTHSL